MTEATRLEIRRRLPAPPERVFAAWTEPALLGRWMSPFAEAEAQVDVRVGGVFTIVMHGQGQTIRHSGSYLELEPPTRLVFTWQSPYTGSRPSIVTVLLRAVDAETEMTLIHEHLPPDAVASHSGGWGQMLEHLSKVVAEPWT